MNKITSSRVLRTIGVALLLNAGIWGVIEEVAFRSKAQQTMATVREWQPEKLFGFKTQPGWTPRSLSGC